MVNVPSIPDLFVSHWHVSPSLTALAGVDAALYLAAAARVRGGWPARRTVAFLAGIGTVLLALESGIDVFDDRLLSVHMVQHMLLLMIAPLLLLAGHPVLLTLRALPPRRRPQAARMLGRLVKWCGPLVSLSTFAVVLVGTHVPAFYDATLTHPALHELEHALYLGAGLLLWSPLLDTDPVPQRRLGGLARLGYLLAAMPVMALLGAYLNRHPTLVYHGYGPPARVLGIIAVTDQQQAGAIMWVGGGTIMVFVGLWVAMVVLLGEERRQRVRDAREAVGSTEIRGVGG